MQGRTRDKVQRILTVAAELLDQVGPDAITTTMIAKAAGVSITTVYRFFPDKEAIFDEIVRLHIEKMSKLSVTHFSSPAARGTDGIDIMVDSNAHFMLSEPGFRSLWLNGYLVPGQHELYDQMKSRSIDDSLKLVVGLGLPDTPQTAARMEVAAEIGEALLRLAMRKKAPDDQKLVLDELRTVLKAYFPDLPRTPGEALRRAAKAGS
jgi:AcrR family transcriptional regulator